MEQQLSAFFTPETAANAGFIEKTVPPGAGADPLVTGLEYDSRSIKPGNLYFALPGLHADGHAFIADAVKKGAAVVVHQEKLPDYPAGAVYIRVRDSRFAMSPMAAAFYGHPSRSLAVVGVTGTEGKSTTVYLIYQLLRLAGKKAGFISTVQYSDGGEEQWNPEHQTTPEATAIHKRLADMRDNGVEYAILESSSHGLSKRTNRLGDAAFDAAVMTNVTHEHLEFHGTWEQYRCDKANLFRALGRGSHVKGIEGSGFAVESGRMPRNGDALAAGLVGNGDRFTTGVTREVPCFGVINVDDPSAAYFIEAGIGSVTAGDDDAVTVKGGARRRMYTYSTKGAAADLSLDYVESEAEGNRYRVTIRNSGGGSGGAATDHAAADGSGPNETDTLASSGPAAPATALISDRLPGAFNAGNVLAALLTVSGLLAVPVTGLIPLAPRLKPVRGRMTAVAKGQPFEVLVDYAHTPSSFNTIFPPLRERLNKSGKAGSASARIISLFGSAGERDTAKRPEQGRIAAEWSDIVILTDEDPRGEDPMTILKDIAQGIPGTKIDIYTDNSITVGKNKTETLFLIPDRPTAIRKAFSLARSGDLVLLLGKGHENSIIYTGNTKPYDEIAEAEKALAEMGFV
ncbi:UDP-N-acetylmuramyl-tripeptide synthetase [Spirochaetia bacterium]|nr:UDP-N-acetylmuramyl-tripeptide synthetase [Spirochaetia bacterium]